jgi:hypothetical protein
MHPTRRSAFEMFDRIPARGSRTTFGFGTRR